MVPVSQDRPTILARSFLLAAEHRAEAKPYLTLVAASSYVFEAKPLIVWGLFNGTLLFRVVSLFSLREREVTPPLEFESPQSMDVILASQSNIFVRPHAFSFLPFLSLASHSEKDRALHKITEYDYSSFKA
jgi:hypothetical protein